MARRLSLLLQKHVRITPRLPADEFEPLNTNSSNRRVSTALAELIGREAVVARSVNYEPGLWVGFSVDNQTYWLRGVSGEINSPRSDSWIFWFIIALIFSLVGAAFIAWLMSNPIKQLRFAAGRMHKGDFDGTRLDEQAASSEIREVNIGFNRMAEKLAEIEENRAIMLAGISHDLRTPLARLRLETEMSVQDPEARAHMAADIIQLDAIIDKFMEYARPQQARLSSLSLKVIVQAAAYDVADYPNMQVDISIPDQTNILGDEVDLARVFSNLLENAYRYAKDPATGAVHVEINAKEHDRWVLIKVRDHGTGVNAATLANLTKPFFRGDTARTSATGAGLGLAIAEKTIQRMGGTLALTATSEGNGLVARIKLRKG